MAQLQPLVQSLDSTLQQLQPLQDLVRPQSLPLAQLTVPQSSSSVWQRPSLKQVRS